MKNIHKYLFAIGTMAMSVLSSCQKGDLADNPNIGNTASASLLLNAVSNRMARGGGVINGEAGNVSEDFWGPEYKFDQYFASNYSYYQGTNTYNWSYSATHYNMLWYAKKLEKQAAVEGAANPTGAQPKAYTALAKFYEAFGFIWYAQRVGDMSMVEASDEGNLQPKFDTQKEVFKASLLKLDTANLLFKTAINNGGSGVVDATGDIFGLTYLQWQKIINAYKLRVLISLSKRADDNADLDIKGQFSKMVNDPIDYPLPTANSDNLVYKYNSINAYPYYNFNYNIYANISSTYLNLTTSNKDPRTYFVATPAPAQLSAGKTVSDFTSYVGADNSLGLSDISSNSSAGKYSFLNYARYASSATGANAEPYILIGYSEMCFNIAEGINRGWAIGDAKSWYDKGVDASLNNYGITDGLLVTIYDNAGLKGKKLGTVNVDIPSFKSAIAYKSGADGLRQILEQKYVALFLNSNWEAFYNYRRTGIPTFAQGGPGIGTDGNKIPRRWQYPVNTTTENAQNYQSAIQSQFGGTDDVMQDTWLTK